MDFFREDLGLEIQLPFIRTEQRLEENVSFVGIGIGLKRGYLGDSGKFLNTLQFHEMEQELDGHAHRTMVRTAVNQKVPADEGISLNCANWRAIIPGSNRR